MRLLAAGKTLGGGPPLRGGASYEAEGRRGARSGGAGRVGPPATRRRLCVLRQIGDERRHEPVRADGVPPLSCEVTAVTS